MYIHYWFLSIIACLILFIIMQKINVQIVDMYVYPLTSKANEKDTLKNKTYK